MILNTSFFRRGISPLIFFLVGRCVDSTSETRVYRRVQVCIVLLMEDFDNSAEKPGVVAVKRSSSICPSIGGDELSTRDLYVASIAEFLATFFFVAFSVSGIVACEVQLKTSPALTWLAIVGYHVILIIIVIFAFANLSGAHFNPAVTVALLSVKRVTVVRAVFYVVAQLIGSIAGSGLVKGIMPVTIVRNLAVSAPLNGASAVQAMGAEMLGTFGLVFGTFSLAFDPRGWGLFAPVGGFFFVYCLFLCLFVWLS